MEPTVTVVVLVSALMHAAWNAVVKGGEDALCRRPRSLSAARSLPFLTLFRYLSESGSLFYLALSAAIHCAYFAALAVGYGSDLSFVYPIARGTGPILVALLSAFLIGEILSVPQLASVSIICFGLFTLA